MTTRLALDRLRSARARREFYTEPWLPEPLLLTSISRKAVYVFDVDRDGRIANVYGIFNPDKPRHVLVDAYTP
jgi:hypothetical protein